MDRVPKSVLDLPTLILSGIPKKKNRDKENILLLPIDSGLSRRVKCHEILSGTHGAYEVSVPSLCIFVNSKCTHKID